MHAQYADGFQGCGGREKGWSREAREGGNRVPYYVAKEETAILLEGCALVRT